MLKQLISIVLITSISACSALPRVQAVPKTHSAKAVIQGMQDIRYVVGNQEDMTRFAKDMADTWRRERAWLASQGKNTENLPTSHLLALSGGGDKGAFGAGFLNGWSAAGDRPEFLLVTGISTGALIAPFAFLGPSYDEQLKKFYTESTPKDIIHIRGLLAALTNDAVADTAPLRKMLRKYITQSFLDAIAVEYSKGRELWISTTNLDTSQRVIWNMTKIAASKHPRSVELFQDVMIASAAIPGAFPPIMVDSLLDGKPYQEMHVDGGALSQVFVYPPNIDLGELSRKNHGERKRKLYIIMNARLDPEWAETERKAISIASRAITTMIHSQGIGDLYRIYLTTQRDGVEFNLAYIPSHFNHPHLEEFDTAFMKDLYRLGFEASKQHYPWQQLPPDYHAHH
jgi:predicted acylesterase/phospholipase RssA